MTENRNGKEIMANGASNRSTTNSFKTQNNNKEIDTRPMNRPPQAYYDHGRATS
jgi:hypothetical protein